MVSDPHTLVADTLARFEDRLREHDVEGAVACFLPTGAIYGDGDLEQAHGAAELRTFFRTLLDSRPAFGWDLGRIHVRGDAVTVWFVADAKVVVRPEAGESTDSADGPDNPDNSESAESTSFRMSGILRGHHGFWRFELFNGLMPLIDAYDAENPRADTEAPALPLLRLLAGGRTPPPT